ncbi:DNA recombination-mediator protein A [uncultured archaeon]|nr:DNA recombination-mediator protein A [uncultured archaeon]
MEPISILALQQISGVGVKTIEKILSITDLLEPTCPLDLIEILKKANGEFGRISIPDIQDANKGWDKAHEIINISQKQNIKIISRESPYYPECLSIIDNPPVLLHVKGNLEALNKNSIAIVGTRKPSDFGKNQAKKIAKLFAKEGYVVISGLAEGIDSAAHKGALETNGQTVAVLAHGLDIVYPYKNKELADAIIINNGALVSEYPSGTKIFNSFFVERDRIQSGLSLGVLVIETGIKGGTMHTVGFCEKQKRVLIVMKHPLNSPEASKQSGNNQLIADNRANIVFENDDDVYLAKTLMQKKKDELYALKSAYQSGSKITSMSRPSLLVTLDRCEHASTIKEEVSAFVSAYKLNLSVPLAGYAQSNKKKKRGKKISATSNNRKLEDFEDAH